MLIAYISTTLPQLHVDVSTFMGLAVNFMHGPDYFSTDMTGCTSLADLNGLGPKSCEMLARAGITTLEQLQQMGSIAAYVKARAVNTNTSLNLLWGIESVLTGVPWQQVSRVHRTSLLFALEHYEQHHRNDIR